jgi:hypothetical protein
MLRHSVLSTSFHYGRGILFSASGTAIPAQLVAFLLHRMLRVRSRDQTRAETNPGITTDSAKRSS